MSSVHASPHFAPSHSAPLHDTGAPATQPPAPSHARDVIAPSVHVEPHEPPAGTDEKSHVNDTPLHRPAHGVDGSPHEVRVPRGAPSTAEHVPSLPFNAQYWH